MVRVHALLAPAHLQLLGLVISLLNDEHYMELIKGNR